MEHLAVWFALIKTWGRSWCVGHRRLAAWVAALAIAISAPVAAQEAADSVTLNLENADIRALIDTVSELTGKNFVVDSRVSGNVTVISAAPTTRAAIYDVFLSILKVHGLAAVPSGNVIKIIPDAIARQEGGAITAAPARLAIDEIVTAVIPLAKVDATAVLPVVRPLLPQQAHLAAHPQSNALIVADSAGNVDRIIKLVQQMDHVSGDADFEIVELKNASASAVTTLLADLVRLAAPNPAAPPQIPLVADERTNSLLLAGSASEKLKYRSLIDKLDVPVSHAEGIEVIFLKFASAADLAPVIQGLFSGAAALAPKQQGAAQQPAAGPEGVLVQADETTNALIIQGPPPQMVRMKAVIEQLDIRRTQVLVEGVIAEVSSTAADELGVQWLTSMPGQNGVFAGSEFAGEESGPITAGIQAASGAVSIGTGLTIGYFRNGDLRGLLRALRTDQYANVLSTPTLVTLDNTEAEIVVGQNVPFITGQFTNNTTTPENPFQTIERQDVGIILRVKPQINEGDTVTLEIEQEVSSIDRDSTGSDLITNQRSIKTTVLVDDRALIVLGGLVSDELRENQQKIPFLGDLPVLGTLFRNSGNDAVKTNLMVFLRPSIMRTAAAAADLTNVRYDDIRGKQIEQEGRGRGLFPNPDGPELPNRDGLLQ